MSNKGASGRIETGLALGVLIAVLALFAKFHGGESNPTIPGPSSPETPAASETISPPAEN